MMKNEQKDNNTKKPIIPRTAEPKARERSVKRLKREFEELEVDMQTDGGTHFEVSLVHQQAENVRIVCAATNCLS